MTSNRDRDRRAAARARLEREMALRADAARQRRRTQTIIAGGAAALVLVGAIVWIAIAVGGDGENADPTVAPDASGSVSASPTSCEYKPLVDPSASASQEPLPASVKEVGKPEANVPRSGKQVMTINTNLGEIAIEMDLAKTPCTAGSFAYLAGKKFFDNTKCHRLVADIGALQCGDPGGDGTGGPTYRFGDENLPVNRRPAYPEGAVAMANAGPDTNGSQFFFVFKDSPLQAQYSLFGKITKGMDIIKKIAEGGDDGAYAQQAGGGRPKTEIVFQTVTVSPVTA
ncbi:peptidylprolyl isomerase [Virgisporangium ochraceum]|uniref:peptidylprolyl isomerase n=1 Tax=Virgisporangium ochraceum TaxID=65505 RepID=UPI001EF37766|nr:peptidylprolyl isomerase [Virgisporangium ochraceum]